MFQVTILSDLEASKSIIINKRQLREFIHHHHYHYIDRILCRAMFFFIITKVENPKQKNPKRNWHAWHFSIQIRKVTAERRGGGEVRGKVTGNTRLLAPHHVAPCLSPSYPPPPSIPRCASAMEDMPSCFMGDVLKTGRYKTLSVPDTV